MGRRQRRVKPKEDAGLELKADLYAAFGGVAIVLLLAALCAMGVPEIKASEHAKLIAKLTEKQKEVEQAEVRAAEAEGQLEPRPLDVVIAFDGSESMKPWMDKARTSIESMAEVCARIAPRFRLGLVVYRDLYTTSTVFELQAIGATEKGVRSPGMKALLAFCNEKTEIRTLVSVTGLERAGRPTGETRLDPKLSGYLTSVDLRIGILKAASMFDDASARKLLVVISDVGPWELTDPNTISADERAVATELRDQVSAFSGPHSCVLALFTGADDASLMHKIETEAFFRSIADAAGEAGTYSDDANQLAALVLAECFKRRGKTR